MKRFKFKFVLVLENRKQNEQQALLLLSQKQRAFQLEIAKKEFFNQKLSRSLDRREGLGSTAVSIVEFHSEQNYIEGMKQRMIQADHRILKANREMERARFRYLDTRKRTKMIESLKDKKLIEFKKEKSKKEQKDLDDLIVMRFRLKEDLL